MENRLLQDQHAWYAKSARRQAAAAERYKYIGLALAVGATLLGVVAGVWPALRAELWIGVVTTVSAAFAAYAMVDRRQQMALAYAQTSTKLNRLDAWFGDSDTKPPFSQLVTDAEDTILAENRGWSDIMTRATVPSRETTPPVKGSTDSKVGPAATG